MVFVFEIAVPSTLHGSVCNDGWFANGVAWSKDESRVAYVAEVHLWVDFCGLFSWRRSARDSASGYQICLA